MNNFICEKVDKTNTTKNIDKNKDLDINKPSENSYNTKHLQWSTGIFDDKTRVQGLYR